jgi:hypothetical protein
MHALMCVSVHVVDEELQGVECSGAYGKYGGILIRYTMTYGAIIST